MDYKFSSKSRSLLNEIIGGINKLLAQTEAEYGSMSEYIEQLKSLICAEFGEYTDKTLEIYASFIAKVSLLAYFQKFDNDKRLYRGYNKKAEEFSEADFFGDLGEEESKAEENLRKAESKFDYDIDYKFGFDILFEYIESVIELVRNRETSKDLVEQTVTANLLANIRDVSVEEYLTGGYIDKDIQLVALLGEEEPVNTFEKVMDFIKTDNNYKSTYTMTVDCILGTYKYLLQDGFGLRPYIGVLSLSDGKCHVITESNRLGVLSGSETAFQTVAYKLSNYYKVAERSDRQYDIKGIVNGDNSVKYFPNKLLEYSQGRILTYNLAEKIYKTYEKADSWEHYSEGYVAEQVDRLVCEAIYYAMEKHFDFSTLGVSEESFTSEEFMKAWGTKAEILLSSVEMKSAVDTEVRKVMRSMCTGCVVVAYNNLGGTINSIKLRIVDVDNNLSRSLTKVLFGSLSPNPSIQYEDGYDVTEGRFMSDGSTRLPFKIIEYAHDFNAGLTNAEPLFGYKAVELFKARGIPIVWEKILLGEDRKGTPMFASIADKDDLPMQANAVHNIIAGSRSGKGVMTMNLLASGLACGKAIFYIDKKPDMSILFHELTGGNMFIVNGGAYKSSNDPRGLMPNGCIAMDRFQQALSVAPSYIKGLFSENYDGMIGDYVYFRAVLFTMGILMARTNLANNEVYNSLGGDTGIIIVVDEFLSWQEKFENLYLHASSEKGFGNANRIKGRTREQYKKIKNDIKVTQAKLGMEDIKADKKLQLQLDLETKTEKLKEIVTEKQAYCTTAMEKFLESMRYMSNILIAGFRDKEERISDIFVIGQKIDINGCSANAYTLTADGSYASNVDTKSNSLMRGMFDSFSHDWFMGYNKERSSYMGATGGTAKKLLSEELRYFAYCQGEMETIRKEAPSGTRYFKPYLVLNNNFEDDPKDPKKMMVNGELVEDPDYQYVSQCRYTVNKAVPGANMWEKVRLKHLATEDTSYGNLNDGIGFLGLARLTRESNGGGDFNPRQDLSKSKEIADFVAQRMGYADYYDMLFDFTPNGLFSVEDIVKAIQNPASFQDVNARLPIFAEFGFIGGGIEETEDLDYSDSSYEDEIIDEEVEDHSDEVEDIRQRAEHTSTDTGDDDWYSYDEDEEEDEDDMSDEEIRDFCRTFLGNMARQYGVTLTSSEINNFCNKIVNALKGVGV